MFEKYVEQALNIFSYVDSIALTDDKGIIKYFHTNRSDINMLDKSQILGTYILDMYQNLTRENSTVLKVLSTGVPILNQKQELVNTSGLKINAITSTLPIEENGKIVGTIDVSSYAVEPLTLSERIPRSPKTFYQLSDIVSIDSRMNELKENIKKISQTSSAVMIHGETGTGKELFAQSIHTCGNRRKGRFISQNCAAIPSTLMESILFGTKKGAFTGAEDSPGLFELADGGTLFLDEINSMESSIQPKLLKAVEEKKITRIGGSQPICVDVKIISAVNDSQDGAAGSPNIRKDLLYRLNTVCLNIPPLRERIVDIGPLAKFFINEFNYHMNKNILDLTDEVYAIFSDYHWPGNVRELKNIIEGAFDLSSGRFIEKKDLPEYLTKKEYAPDSNYMKTCKVGLKGAMEQIEKEIILETLKDSSCRAEAARKLKLSKQSFQYKLEKYQLEDFFKRG
ncbi:MAG: sigma-54 interaction domain-containing protein [Anaerovoracaceae bacterium]